ncbi:MAG: hybrid sensor histidine kinase/response regulator [Chloroflexi bacterium]|nr:hybrid sensor histidine kinase/response regulator [Chloroflexota bacterium]
MRALETGLPQRVPILGVRGPDGVVAWSHVVAVPLPSRGRAARRVVTVWTDITPIVQRETALDRSNADLERRVVGRTATLEAMAAELEPFSYSVSHDLRSPLKTICLLVDSLLAGSDEDQSVPARETLERIQVAAKRMDGLIEVLLELATTARLEPQRAQLDLTAIAHDELERFALSEPARRVQTKVRDGLVAYGDERLVRTVLHNLIGNAWKFTACTPQPKIEVGAQLVARSDAFFVRDNGPGFAMDHADEIFLPFHRLPQSEPFEGSGVGLAIVQRIVGRHGGRVWAKSAEGVGATFFFTLPDL